MQIIYRRQDRPADSNTKIFARIAGPKVKHLEQYTERFQAKSQKLAIAGNCVSYFAGAGLTPPCRGALAGGE